MRAALYDRYGPPEVLYEGTLPKPVPGPGEVLVRVHAATVNGGELLGRA
ncbi:NAD(P)-dependent alcohol dehydrogenase, partial [Nonomuraea sp. NPDC055795]